jgi:fumarate reductase subunit C
MSGRRPYLRPMDGWWKRDPYFIRYMAREATALLVAAYAVVLLAGLVRLAQGEAAFNHWLEYMKHPRMLAFHLVVLATFLYHTWSWFSIMPKTMPPILIGGKRVQPGMITGAGIAAAAVASLAVLVIVRVMHS